MWKGGFGKLIKKRNAGRIFKMSSSSEAKQDAFITDKEAREAIYIDFEGFVEKSPTLVGVLIEGEFEQTVFDLRLFPAAEAKGLQMAALPDFVAEMVELSLKQNRCIVAYSQHEKNLILKYAGIGPGDRYRDARKIAVRWKKRLYPTQNIKGYGLKDFLKFINYPRGDYLGEMETTSRLRAVIGMLERRVNYNKLTPVVKAKWTKLLQHNKIDCTGMCALTLRAAKEIAASG